MMKILHDEWVILFHSAKDCIPSDPFISTIFCDSKKIIDDKLFFSNHIPTLFYYFSCVAQVFTKYLLSFKLNKYDFVLSRVEYVGHDLTAETHCLTLTVCLFVTPQRIYLNNDGFWSRLITMKLLYRR